MSEEPRRSGRATKGKGRTSLSPPPKKQTKAKPQKKSADPEPQEEEEEEDDDVIRCICGNTNPKDKRAFIGCDACSVWQHNVCMGMPEEEDDVPEHYFCEDCRPQEHQETIRSLERGDKPPIWETRNKIWQNEKKMSKNRKSKSRGEDGRPGWLKNDVTPAPEEPKPAETESAPVAEAEAEPQAEAEAEAEAAPAPAPAPATNGGAESGNKRKREDVTDEPDVQTAPAEEKRGRTARQDKRRKSSTLDSKMATDADTALVKIGQLPKDRQSAATALNKIITGDIQQRVKSGIKLLDGQTPDALGEHHAARIEYALHMNHTSGSPGYKQQFMALNANLKKNKVLIERLMDGSLTADELSTMNSSDMASEEQQRERAAMKEALDRQAIAVTEEGPKYKQDHKGFHLIEETGSTEQGAQAPSGATSIGPREGTTQSPIGGAPPPLSVDTGKPSESGDRRPSSQHLDMNNIWAKTAAQSPTVQQGTRGMPAPSRRTSSIQPTPTQQNGAKDDPDVDRMLEDDDQSYSPADTGGDDAVVWRGKLIQANEDDAPIVNARFVAGRDLAPTISWSKLLPDRLSIDGRLAKEKAEDYLCGLRWSSSSDVAVVSLTPYDNLDAFNAVFNYFRSRSRYAVVEKDKPRMVKDLYIVPVEAGDELPTHIGLLEHCTIKTPIEERLLLATFVVARAPESPAVGSHDTPTPQQAANGHLPHHTRQSISGGPAGSPINAQTPSFSPASSAFPGNPYAANAPPQAPPVPTGPPPSYYQSATPHPSPNVNEILGQLQYAPTAQMILSSADLTRDQLQNLRTILNEEPSTREDFNALTKKLFSETA